MTIYRAIGSFVLLLWSVSAQSFTGKLPDFTGLVEQYSKAVVNISTTQTVAAKQMPHGFNMPDFPDGSPFNELFKHFFGDGRMLQERQQKARSLGSGFIISADGYVITNHHVVDGADEILVRTTDRREFQAQVIGSDKRSDIALIKIDGSDLPTVKLGKGSEVKVGEWVLAIGSPFGFDHSVTAGIVSALGRSLPSENYVPFIQTDVAINPGNSGGPLFNLDGEVIGVNSQIYSRTGGFMGLSFAIPIDMAVGVTEQLRSRGYVSRGWLGVLIQDVNKDLAETFGMEQPHGALIAEVVADGPADRGGLQAGDVIMAFNGEYLESSSELPPLVGLAPVGKRAELLVLRDGEQKTMALEIGELPNEDDEQVAAGSGNAMTRSPLGMLLADLTEDQRSEAGIAAKRGVLVAGVSAGPASQAGIKQGDVILMMDNQKVNTAAQLRGIIENLKPGRSVAVLIQRGGSRLFLALRVPREKD